VENGVKPFRAAIRGVREVGFTVLAMSVSLVAVFIPMWLVGGLVGQLFKEFAVTLSVAIMFSLLISLMLTPMMAARLLPDTPKARPYFQGVSRFLERIGQRVAGVYQRSLGWALRHKRLTMLSLLLTILL